MIALDTNILVYAHRVESAEHDRARAALDLLSGSGRSWAVPWPCVHEFFTVVTHPRVYADPTDPDAALASIHELLGNAGARAIGEVPHHLDLLAGLVSTSRVTGSKIHDARIAAICLGHDVTELWTADRDFSRFPALRTRNPLVGTGL